MSNIHPTQKNLLNLIKSREGSLEGLSLRDIGEKIGVGRKPQIVSYHIQQLEKRGILREEDSFKKLYTILDNPISSVSYINLYSCTAECGAQGLLGNDMIIDRIPLPTRTFGISNPNNFFLIKARGDSMEPMIKEGDLILAKKQEEIPSNGAVMVLVHEDMPKIKKISRENINGQLAYCLESLNNINHPRKFITNDSEDLRIVGLVKGIISKPVN